MSVYQPVKCAAAEFSKAPFYRIQHSRNEKRYVASFCSEENIKRFLETFIDLSASDLKIRIHDFGEDHDNPVEFDAIVSKSALKAAMLQFEDVLLHDGYYDFMIKRPETDDYVCFDEHGLIFIYTREDYSETLQNYGLAFKADEPLIYEYNHWHIRPANGEAQLSAFIETLGMKRKNNL